MSTTRLGIYDEIVESVDPTTGLAKMKRVPHIHTKHNIGINLKGPSQSGLTMQNLQVNLCPKCHLLWFEELPDLVPVGGNHG